MSENNGNIDTDTLTVSSRARRLQIPDHALLALERQARRHYRRWWLDEAERIARMVIYFDVGRAGAWFMLGDIEMRRMNWQRAFDHFQQAVDCHRANAMAWCRGAEALFHLGELAAAQKWLKVAISSAPPDESPGARRARRFLARHRGDFAQASEAAADPKPAHAPTMKLKAFQQRGTPQKYTRKHVRNLRKYRKNN